MQEEQKRVYCELSEIFKNIDKEKVMKIPIEILEEIKKNTNEDVRIHIDWDRPLSEQELSEDTLNILGWINVAFWTEGAEEKQKLYSRFYKNKREQEELYNEYNQISVYEEGIFDKLKNRMKKFT